MTRSERDVIAKAVLWALAYRQCELIPPVIPVGRTKVEADLYEATLRLVRARRTSQRRRRRERERERKKQA